MSDVSGVTGNSQTSQSGGSSAATSGQNIGKEFNSFIQLLTAQIQNQDPLAPLDSTQFVEQLATFSSLEQQVRSNTSLESIATMMSDLHAMLASQWLGETVSIESSWVPYSGEPVNFEVDIPEGVDKAIMTVLDSDGNIIWTETLDKEAESYTWKGQTQSGEPAGEDIYQVGIDLYKDGNALGTIAPRIITKVTDVASENGTMKIGTSSNLTTDIDNVQKVDS